MLRLELLVADRDHVERRLERVGSRRSRATRSCATEVEGLERLLAHLEGGARSPMRRALPEELEPLTTKPLVAM